MSVAVMYRQVQQVKASQWPAFLDMERRMDAAEEKTGYPLPRRYRAMFGGESTNTRVCVRIFESYAEFGRLIAERFLNDALARLDAEKFNLIEWDRDELYYLDSGAAVPRWMQAISRKPFEPEHIACAIPRPTPAPRDPERIRKNIEAGKVRVLYRQIQHVPRECWAEKMEQERLSDEAELRAGNPLPLRYRAMHTPMDSHTRVSEREYDSMEDMCRLTEAFFQEATPEDAGVMDAECRRQAFFTWEREELYYVDSDSFEPAWMSMGTDE